MDLFSYLLGKKAGGGGGGSTEYIIDLTKETKIPMGDDAWEYVIEDDSNLAILGQVITANDNAGTFIKIIKLKDEDNSILLPNSAFYVENSVSFAYMLESGMTVQISGDTSYCAVDFSY